MPSCSAYGCTQRRRENGTTLHRFPKDPIQRQKWIEAVRRKDFIPSLSAVLCSKHFKEEDIDRTSLSYVRIRDNAVPSVFDGFPEYLQKKQKPRKPPKVRHITDSFPVIAESSTSAANATSSTSAANATLSTSAANATSSTSSANATSSISAANATSSISAANATSSTSAANATSSTSAANATLSTSAANATSSTSAANATLSTSAANATSSTSAANATSSTSAADRSVHSSAEHEPMAWTPKMAELKRKLDFSQTQLQSSRKKIKLLQQSKRRLLHRNATLSAVINDLRKHNLPSTDSLQVLDSCASSVPDLLKQQIANKTGEALPVKYSPELRSFALKLHLYSPHAYN